MSKLNKSVRYIMVVIILMMFSLNSKGEAVVINSIMARIYDNVITKRDHIITRRDFEIEYSIQKKVYGEEAITRESVLNEMIDTYLVMLEIRKVPSKNLIEESAEKIDKERKEFKSLFTKEGYDEFLKELELTEKDISLRFKNKVLVENYLKRKIQTKKNGSNLDKNMILESDIKKLLSDYASDEIKKLRDGSSKIMINDFVE